MKKPSLGVFGVLGLVAALATVGCGGSDGDNGHAATLTSCNAYCDMYGAAACGASGLFTDAADCKTSECQPIPAAAPSGCQSALKTYYDCRKTQADICADDGCDAQATAFFTACS